jgi:hypothetical protein
MIARDFIGTIRLRAVQSLDHPKDIDESGELRVSTP